MSTGSNLWACGCLDLGCEQRCLLCWRVRRRSCYASLRSKQIFVLQDSGTEGWWLLIPSPDASFKSFATEKLNMRSITVA